MNEYILASYSFDKSGKATTIDENNIIDCISSPKMYWLHLDATSKKSKSLLKKIPGIDDIVLKALLEEDTSPRLTEMKTGSLLFLRGMNYNDKNSPEDMVSIRVWVTKNNVITLRRRKLKAIDDLKAKIESGSGPKTIGDFICLLTSYLFDRMKPCLNDLDNATDDIEERIIETADTSLRDEILTVRKRAIIFKRYLAPQREAIHKLIVSDLDFLDENQKKQIRESYYQITRYIEDLDAIRERAQIVKDEISNTLSDRLNKNTYILSIIASIFLPLGFLTGLLGVNVGGIPGSENSDGFYITCAILFIIFILQIVIFKKAKWF